MAKKKKKASVNPPPGYYDPALDAQLRASNRGLQDLVLDTSTQTGRNLSDFLLGQQDIARQRTEFGEDIASQRQSLETGYGRNLTDLLTQRTQGQEDYTRNLAQLQRNYDQLATAQAGQQRKAGVSGGGAVAQAQQKRAANQAWEKSPIDTAFNRFLEGSKLTESRLGEDRATGLADLLRSEQRGYGSIDRAGGQLGLGYQRGNEDLNTQLARAQRENTQYGLDVGATKFAQATQMGWKPPAAPKSQAALAAEQRKRAQAAAKKAQQAARAAARG